jgi:hypothetical protein
VTEWKRTGTPAHNNSTPRDIEDQPNYQANPQCAGCAGAGFVWTETIVRDADGEPDDIDMIREPCDCIFVEWTVKPDPNCSQCCGIGAVQERMIVKGEQVIFFHDCVCLRYINEDDTNVNNTH